MGHEREVQMRVSAWGVRLDISRETMKVGLKDY